MSSRLGSLHVAATSNNHFIEHPNWPMDCALTFAECSKTLLRLTALSPRASADSILSDSANHVSALSPVLLGFVLLCSTDCSVCCELPSCLSQNMKTPPELVDNPFFQALSRREQEVLIFHLATHDSTTKESERERERERETDCAPATSHQ